MCFSSGSKKHVGKSCFIEEDTKYYAGGFMGILRIKNGTIDNHFLAYLLNSSEFKALLSGSSKGSNINNLSNKIEEIEIPQPPISIQQQIVSECEAEDKLYADSKSAINVCTSKKSTIINGIKANRVEKLKELCKKINLNSATL